MRLLDFHTHLHNIERCRGDSTVIAVRSLMPGEEPDDRSDYFTVGIHPMEPDHTVEELEQLAQRVGSQLIGIGECGWDGRSPLSMERQTELVRAQIRLADRLGLPIIYHVVGGWHLLLSERKAHPEGIWIVHGFRGKPALLRQLEEADIRVSLHPKYHWEAVPTLPFFLETDDSDTPLSEVYERAARTQSISKEELSERLLAQLRSSIRL